MTSTSVKTLRFVTVLTALCLITIGCGEPEVATSPAMDAIEQELETSRHAVLLARIAETDVAMGAFTTDGCSGGLSLAWTQVSERYPEFENTHGGKPPWEDCCIAHDRAYHAGGEAARTAVESFEQRRAADLALRACVIEAGATRSDPLRIIYGLTDQQVEVLYETIADLMYRAVRLGGVPCTDAAWRWGYGWPECSAT